MTWLQRYGVRHDVANAIWILPLLSMVAVIGAVHFFSVCSAPLVAVQLASAHFTPRTIAIVYRDSI